MKIPFITVLALSLSLTACYSKPYAHKPQVNKPNPVVKPVVVKPIAHNRQTTLLNTQIAPRINAQVALVDSALQVTLNQRGSQVLTTVYYPLFRSYKHIYVKAFDDNRDGFKDLAILSSVGSVGTPVCYRLYHYQPSTQNFVIKRAVPRCNLPI